MWERTLFQVHQQEFEACDVVVLDEFGSNLDMTRHYGRAPAGQRVVEQQPRNTPRNTTTIASLTVAGIGPSLVLSGSVTRVTFETYLEQVLGPSLQPGQIIVLDNLRAHHGGRIAEIVAAHGCRLCYLAPYSPDYSPIELAFAKIKAELRRVAARTLDALEQAIGEALKLITAADARAFFAHCGYRQWPVLEQ